MPATRCRVYHPDLPEGKVLFTTEEVAEHLQQGWSEDYWLRDLKKEVKILDNHITEIPIYKEYNPNNSEPKKYCECGCGQEVKKRFVHGHYGKKNKKLREANVNGQDSQAATRKLSP